jgi:hypothetical protein
VRNEDVEHMRYAAPEVRKFKHQHEIYDIFKM